MYDDLDRRYYLDIAAAFVRGRQPAAPPLPAAALLHHGLEAGLRLHKFKRTDSLPRVRRVLGILRGLAPADLLDVGSGRGAFLWPLLDALPWLPVLAIDLKPQRVADLHAVRAGGIERLTAARMDATRLALAGKCVDVVTFLEVLEHIPDAPRALAEAVRVARRFVVVSVPSKEDDNPEHIHLFDRPGLETLFRKAGAPRVRFDAVLNHLIAIATLPTP